MDILSQLKLAENIVQTDRQKHDQAFEIYYETAQNSNDKYASYRLGKCYDKAIFVKADKEKAIEQYTISAEAGYVEAQYDLGMLFMMRDSSNDENRKNAIKGCIRHKNPESVCRFRVVLCRPVIVCIYPAFFEKNRK